MADKGCKTSGKNTKTKRQPSNHLGRYTEGRYMEPRVLLEYLPEPNVIPNKRATNILEDAEERVKVEREVREIEKVDSNHSFNATTNEGRESDVTRNLLKDADAENSLDKNLLQEIEQNLLQEAEVDNFNRDAIEQTLLQEAGLGNFSEDDIEQYLQLPASVTTRSGRVSRPLERQQDFFSEEISKPSTDEQTKKNSEVSSRMGSPAVCETAAPLDNWSRVLSALGGPNQRKIRSFDFTPAAKKVLHQMSQLSSMNVEKMLMDILDKSTTSGLNKEELLAETVSSTIVTSKPPVAAVPKRDIANMMALTTAAIISEANSVQIEPAAVCKITAEEPVYFDICADRIKPVARILACKIADCLSQPPACKIAEETHAQPSACKIAEATPSAWKTADIVDLYFSNDEQKSNKVNILKMAKDEVVYPRNC